MRSLTPIAIGLLLGPLVMGGAMLAACSGLDPNPPHPGVHPDQPDPDPGTGSDLLSDPPDGSADPLDASGDAP